ncbi:hypothetical protein ULF88_02060 [Halopseudomonas pachastrellae]|nr:hypothetical protein [Halopseudomonas pachastrellae]
MKKTLLATTLLLTTGLSGILMAAPGNDAPPRERGFERMAEELQLTMSKRLSCSKFARKTARSSKPCVKKARRVLTPC